MTHAAISTPTHVERHGLDWDSVWAKHKDRHCIWIVTSASEPVHSHIFDEVALALQKSFEFLGGTAPLVRSRSDLGGRLPIIFGANIIAEARQALVPSGSIVVNLEQITEGTDWVPRHYIQLLRRYPVFEFSIRNLDAARRLHRIADIHLLQIGYEPVLTRIPRAEHHDIDVLFAGALNERRLAVLNRLRARGLRVGSMARTYGPERDQVLARAKIVLNIHYHDIVGFEIVRMSYLLANRKCIVSEGTPDDIEAAPYAGAIRFVTIDGFEQACMDLLADHEERERLARAGYEAIRRRPQHQFLREALLSLDAASDRR